MLAAALPLMFTASCTGPAASESGTYVIIHVMRFLRHNIGFPIWSREVSLLGAHYHKWKYKGNPYHIKGISIPYMGR